MRIAPLASCTAHNGAADDDRFFSAKVRDLFSGIASGVSKVPPRDRCRLAHISQVAVGHPFDTIKVRLQTEGAGGRFKGPIVRPHLRARTAHPGTACAICHGAH